MKITKIIKSISRTINLGDFNSIRIENGIEAEVAFDDKLIGFDDRVFDNTEENKNALNAAEEKLHSYVRRATANDIRRIREARKDKSE